METVPTRFKRVAEAFRCRFYESSSISSGSDHSSVDHQTSNSPDLYHLVNSFLELDDNDEHVNLEVVKSDSESSSCDSSDLETKDKLRSLLLYDDDDDVKLNIHREAEKAYRLLGNSRLPDFKRRLMSILRDSGFDAGLCKSKWEKRGGTPSGDYEYIDVIVNGSSRYIVEVCLAGEFEIARPTRQYTSLVEVLPIIYVGKVEEVKKVVRLMCKSVRKSMKSVEMHVPPWRRYGYVEAKWFGSYKRTTNETSSSSGRKMGLHECDVEKCRMKKRSSIGFAVVNTTTTTTTNTNYCREDLGNKGGIFGLKVGNLAAAMNGTTMLL